MSRKFAFSRSQGFSLIEVLVAVTILSVGLLALATLQIALVRSSASTKAQSQGLALAKDKLEDLRTFTTLAGYQAINSNNDTVTVGNVAYARTWTVTRYVYNEDVNANGILNESNDQAFQSVGTITGATPASPAGLVANNEFKVIRVVAGWTESSGETNSVALIDATGAISPSDSALISKISLSTSARKIPVIINNPASDTMVIPIAIGNGTNSAATNPKPQIVIGTSTVETQFDVLTYAAINGDTATATQRVETIMVGCTCNYAQAPASTVRGKRPTYWDGYRYTVPIAATYAPPSGADTASATLQSPRCDVCCRDHQDPVGTTGALFSPLRTTKVNGTVTSAHAHYLNKSTNTPAVSGSYKEACRLIRVDGQWRVATDMNNDYFALLATGDGTTAATPVPDSTSQAGTPSTTGAVARYQKFVIDYLAGRFITNSPTASQALATYNTVGATGSAADPYVMSATAPYVLDNPASISINLVDLNGKWMHSRGMYIDYLEQDAVNAITDAKADIACNVNATTLQACILKLLPFTSVNLTEIADWAPLAGTLSVTNFDYSTSLNYGYPVRGKATTAAASAADVNATTNARKSNTSLLDLSFDSISPLDDVYITDIQRFAVGGGSSASTIGNGTFPVTLTYGGTSTVAISYLTTGAASTVSCGLASPYSCNVQNGSSTGGLDVNAGLSIDVGGYNNQQSSTSQTTPTLTGCVGTGNAAGFAVLSSNQASNAPGTAQPYTGSVCNNYQVTAVTTTNPNAGTISWAASPSSPGDGRVNPYPGETTRISFTGRIASAGLLWTPTTAFAVGDIVLAPKWTTGTVYVINDLITNSGITYRALAAHTAGTFATDLAASRWVATTAVDYRAASAHTSGVNFAVDVAASRWTVVPAWTTATSYTTSSVVVPPQWATATTYALGAVVIYQGSAFKALSAHTSGVFGTDLASIRWTSASATTYIATVAHTSSGSFGAQLSAGNWRAVNSVAVTLGLQASTPQTASSCTYTCGAVQSGACKNNKPTVFTAIFPACP